MNEAVWITLETGVERAEEDRLLDSSSDRDANDLTNGSEQVACRDGEGHLVDLWL